MFRRKTLPADLAPAHAAFAAQVDRVESARRALLACLPVGRVDPAPVPVGLDLLRDELAAVAADMATWRFETLDEVWTRCRTAVEESLGAIDRAHAVATGTRELEALLGAVTDVVDPLDVWADAERAWRRLRA